MSNGKTDLIDKVVGTVFGLVILDCITLLVFYILWSSNDYEIYTDAVLACFGILVLLALVIGFLLENYHTIKSWRRLK